MGKVPPVTAQQGLQPGKAGRAQALKTLGVLHAPLRQLGAAMAHHARTHPAVVSKHAVAQKVHTLATGLQHRPRAQAQAQALA